MLYVVGGDVLDAPYDHKVTFAPREILHSGVFSRRHSRAKRRIPRENALFKDDNARWRDAEDVVPYKLEMNKIKFGEAPINNIDTPPIVF